MPYRNGVYRPEADLPPRDTQLESEMLCEAQQEVRRQLLVDGLEAAEADRLITRYADHFFTEQKLAGPQLRAHLPSGRGTVRRSGLRDFVLELASRARVESYFGTDPERAVADKLVSFGVPAEEAQVRARKVMAVVTEEPNGRFRVRTLGGASVIVDKKLGEDGEKSPLHPDNVLHSLAQSVLREYESGVRSAPGVTVSGADTLAEKQASGAYMM